MWVNCQTPCRTELPETYCRRSSDRLTRAAFPFLRAAAVLALFLFSTLISTACYAQNRDVICRDGTGEFEAAFPTGVRVRVGAEKNEGLAVRACEAMLSWEGQHQVVALSAPKLDVDAFGVEMGLGVPVVALQVKKSALDCCMVYEIYSLREPPMLLRRISGGDFYSAADTALDGRIEIWTDDAAAVDGFENFPLRDLDFPPPVVLRFARGRLLNAGSEFRSYYDQKIAEERAKLDARDLADFKNSDGRLGTASGIPAVRLIQLRTVKIRVLEIVWSYLYSGREKEAWRALAEMWPPADMDRIRSALLNVRDRGILSQTEGVSKPLPRSREIPVKIFDGTVVVSPTPGITPKGVKPKPEITPPKVILMERPPPATNVEMELAMTESTLQLVIDSAGKVRSAEVVGSAQAIDEGLLKSTASWKFIPAFYEGEPVASRILLGVSLKR